MHSVPWAIANAVIAVLLHIYFPEPARLSLEQVDTLFAGGKVWVRRSPRDFRNTETEQIFEKQDSEMHEAA